MKSGCDGIELENGDYGRRAVITSAWSQRMIDFVLENGIVELELNDGKGWRGNDLSFLASFPRLQSFTILDLKISSVAPIHFLGDLRALEVITYCQTEIRFSSFPHLEDCAWNGAPKRVLFSIALR